MCKFACAAAAATTFFSSGVVGMGIMKMEALDPASEGGCSWLATELAVKLRVVMRGMFQPALFGAPAPFLLFLLVVLARFCECPSTHAPLF